MELVRDDLKGFSKPPRTPARVVLNNSTLSVFLSDNFGDIQYSLTLHDLDYKQDEKDVNCIKVSNKKDNSFRRLCAMEFSKETP